MHERSTAVSGGGLCLMMTLACFRCQRAGARCDSAVIVARCHTSLAALADVLCVCRACHAGGLLGRGVAGRTCRWGSPGRGAATGRWRVREHMELQRLLCVRMCIVCSQAPSTQVTASAATQKSVSEACGTISSASCGKGRQTPFPSACTTRGAPVAFKNARDLYNARDW